MKGGARRKGTTSDHPSPQPPPHQVELEQEQPPVNDGEDYGNEYDYDMEDYKDYEEEEEQPKLAEGFYEIETVRKKRIRKGETQYLIKWRNWPESANTWEPVGNLLDCSEFIEAYEESMRSGKHRKRRRRSGWGPTPQSKKKKNQPVQQQSPEAAPVPSVHNSNSSNVTENNADNEPAYQSNDSGSLIGFPRTGEMENKNEFDVKSSAVKATSSMNQENVTEFAIHIQEDRAAVEGKPENVGPRVGAKRRKSFAVKRYKQDSNSDPKKDATEKATDADDVIPQDDVNNGLESKNTVHVNTTPPSVTVITKIVKPVNYSTSILNDTEEVRVSFLVMRSDGEEVVVDNNYLKENNPVLLINFYEKHLRYNSLTE